MLSGCYSQISSSGNSIQSADAAYNQLDLNGSRTILEDMLLEDNLEDKQKCEALIRLAHQDWKYYNDYDSAIKRLMLADSIGALKFETWMLVCRLERERSNFGEALNASKLADKYAKSAKEIDLAKTENAQAIFELSADLLENDKPLDKGLLATTSKELSAILESNAGMPKPSKLLLGISLLNNDGENVIRAWQSYFHIQSIENTSQYLKPIAEKLNKVCEKWRGISLDISQQEVLIWSLASSRFYEFIPLYIKANAYPKKEYSQSAQDIITYSEYLQEVKKVTDEYYRTISIGNECVNIYQEWLESRRRDLWQSLSFLSHKTYSDRGFLTETEKHFGARGFTGRTGSFNGYVLCLGHIVDQKKISVDQYGYQADLVFTQIDMMASNGYTSWFWEDKAIGGWATSSEIIQIREAYLEGPFSAWNAISDSSERQKNEEIINAFLNQTYSDDAKLTEGLARKLRFDALNDLYQKLYLKGLRGKDLKLAFLSAYENYRFEASIVAHEGRHSIDRKYMPSEFASWDSEQREFNAKLSQIAFATEPRLELAQMLYELGNSGHSRANRRITDLAVEWLRINKESVVGYSDKKSEFSQIHLMTNEQLKECYMQADRLNK